MPRISKKLKGLDIVRGVLPTHVEVTRWDENKMLSFIEFCKMFLKKEGEKWKWTFPQEKIDEVNSLSLKGDNLYFLEFALRINEVEPKKWAYKLALMYRVFGGVLKRNPAFVTPKIEEAVGDIDKLNWFVRAYRVGKLKTGDEVIMPDTLDRTQIKSRPTIKDKDVELVLLETQRRLIDLYSKIVKEVRPNELKKLSVDRKLHFIKELYPVVQGKKLMKPNMFFNFNVNSSSVRELERKLLAYALGQKEIAEETRKEEMRVERSEKYFKTKEEEEL